ncbi:dirigent protein 22-like [Henckelia pumila]|uniref:dirigent protein 22-like n=1 Tax=Henckelia pumila TaxID=405737 RepID=UPI003C6E24A2
MEKLAIFFMLYLVAMSRVHCEGTPKDPESVEKWFENLPNLKEKLTKFHFFFHDIGTGKNPTAVNVAQTNTSLQSPTFFGLVRVADDALRVASTPESKIIGRAEGIYAADSLEERGMLMTLNFVFTGEAYNGSSLSILGHNPIDHKYREIAVVGGSGVFRLARGIATVSNVWYNVTTQYYVMKYHVVVLHY